ncbi:tetratricopeptide repeat protein [Microbulbifer pacificus]|uniref:O-linked N-acetylglucosamine transferase, SPINDLY family protein n=1 Tax=Microbulbifer pacificus TaxID=407164 RepID=UPI000CF445F3|nr:tetratricopeptide repeat protein [Microbulbifer pacificus]
MTRREIRNTTPPNSQGYDAALAAYNGGKLSRAEAILKKLLLRTPRHADAYHLRGVIFYQTNRLQAAENSIRKALELGACGAFYVNLALVLKATGDTDGAIDAYKHALRIGPESAKACNNLGNLLMEQKCYPEAEALYNRAIQNNANYTVAIKNLGALLSKLGRYDEAERTLRRVLSLAPNFTEARLILGKLLEKNERLDECEQEYRAVHAWGRLQYMRRKNAAWHGLDSIDTATLKAEEPSPPPPWTLLNILGMEPTWHRRAAMRFAMAEIPALTNPRKLLSPVLRHPGEPLKIGYLSADFHDHPTMHLLAGVLEAHDSSRVEIHLFSYGPNKEDNFTRRINTAGFVPTDLSALSDQQSAARISQAGIHILVDLKGYTTGARLGISALRPAPIIVSWLGYPGSLGHKRLADYIIGDRIVTPANNAESFSEKIALMPNCYQPNDNQRPWPASIPRTNAGLPAEGLVFCSFNQVIKINPACFDIWCRLLTSVPGSILWLLDPGKPLARINLLREAKHRGVDPTRVIFAPRVSQQDHLARLKLADIALDTFPCNSHTTASDALWACVPLVTTPGQGFASKVAASLLTTHGFPELIADDSESYFTTALHLATQPKQLESLRRRLLSARETSPLFDTIRFTRDLESLYEAIWSHSLRGCNSSRVIT